MKTFVFFLGLVAYASASCCSHGDAHRVKEQWNALWNKPDSSQGKIVFGREVFREFLEQETEATGLFDRVEVGNPNGAKFSGHMLRVLTGLDLVINLLDTAAEDAELDHLNHQHVAMGNIKAEYFTTMFRVLGGALRQVLQDFDRVAWKNCLKGVHDHLVVGLQ